MKTPEQFLFIAKGHSTHHGCTDSEAIWTAKQFADQEKAALKEKIKRELLTEWTWSDIALMVDVLKKIERL